MNQAGKKKAKAKVAILGGSFDPPTISHIQIACEIYNSFTDISEVWLIPCGDGRSDKSLKTPSVHRLKMLEYIKEDLIPKNVPIFINETEIKRGEYIPTYYLLKEFEQVYPNKEFVFCIGTDLLETLNEWDESDKLVEEFEFIIIPRDGYPIKMDANPLGIYPKKYKVLRSINSSGSSTAIRDRIHSRIESKLNLAINGLTTARVINYIQENNLYSLKPVSRSKK